MVMDFINNDFSDDPATQEELMDIKHSMIYRHIAWLTALRHQLRQPRDWEHYSKWDNGYRRSYKVDEFNHTMEEETYPFLESITTMRAIKGYVHDENLLPRRYGPFARRVGRIRAPSDR